MTARAYLLLRCQGDSSEYEKYPDPLPDIAACNPSIRTFGRSDAVHAGIVQRFLTAVVGGFVAQSIFLPTCPTCAMMWEQAVEPLDLEVLKVRRMIR
jgi:hypothetical protein